VEARSRPSCDSLRRWVGAVLAVTALLVKLGAPWDIVGFVGNAAGAQMVAELGNRVPLDRIALSKHIVALLK